MNKTETLKILTMLSAYYGQGKSNIEAMAVAWHLILQDYEYVVAARAVIEYARGDKRQYGTFPTVGAIVDAIDLERKAIYGVRNAALKKKKYNELTDKQKSWCTEKAYEWLLERSENELTEQFDTIRQKLWAKNEIRLIGDTKWR